MNGSRRVRGPLPDPTARLVTRAMKAFEPTVDVVNAAAILDRDGAWPNFHDAVVHRLALWRGDVRPEDDVWIGPVVEATLELVALEHPFVVDLAFHDCEDVALGAFDGDNSIMDLRFEFVSRGTYADGATPLAPWVRVEFERVTAFALAFLCMRVEVRGRRAVETLRTG